MRVETKIKTIMAYKIRLVMGYKLRLMGRKIRLIRIKLISVRVGNDKVCLGLNTWNARAESTSGLNEPERMIMSGWER